MSLPFSTEEYYQKVIQLQEKLRQSEEERLKLEMKYNEMIQVMKEEEELHFKKLRTKYKQFFEEDRRRQQRNDKILDALERIESRAQIWNAKSEKFKEFKKRYRHNLVAPSSFGKKDANDERPDMKKGVIDNYLNSISTRPKETVQSPSENKYLNLANVNSAAYWKDPKDAEKYDIERGSSEYDFSYSPLKSTKNFENSLKQNKPLPFRSYDYSEHEDPHTNDTPIATTLEVHNTLRRLLKDDVPHIENTHDPEQTATGKGVVKSFTENRTLSDLNKPKKNPLISHINEKNAQTPVATKSKVQVSEDSIVGNFESSVGDLYKSPQMEVEVVNSNVIQGYKEVIEELPIMIEEQKFVENQSTIEATDIGLKTDTVELELVQREDHSKTISQEGEENEAQLRQPEGKSSEENRPNSTSQEDEELRPPDSKRSEDVNEQQNETKTLEQKHNDAIDPQLSNEHQEFERNTVEEDRVRSGNQNETAHSGEYGDSREPLNQDQNKQFLQQYDENGQPLHYDENGQQLQQYDDSGQPLYYPDVDPQYYNQSGEYAQYDENGQLLMQQYDEHGQLLQQYDENGQPIQQYYNSDALQYDEQGQPILQYDENGQPLLHYDENGQPIGHYDENGQLVGQYDENGQLINYDAGLDYNENLPQQQYEENNFQQPEQVQPNAEPVEVQDDNGGSQENNSQDLKTQENVQPDPPLTVTKE